MHAARLDQSRLWLNHKRPAVVAGRTTINTGDRKMDLQRYEALLLEMDERVMTGAPMTPEAHRLHAALRMLTHEASANHHKMSERFYAMKSQVDALRDHKARLEDRLTEEVRSAHERSKEEARNTIVLRRQMGIWRAKAKRLEAAA